jgi:hypothetical protein
MASIKQRMQKRRRRAHLDKLPGDILKRYNVGDTENTFLLAEYCVGEFAAMDFDWEIDHKLYIGACKRLAKAKRKGILLNVPQLQATSNDNRAEMAKIDVQFKLDLADGIKGVEADLLAKRLAKFKKPAGVDKYLLKGTANKDWSKNLFNPGSNTQLENLFCKQLGVTPVFFTPKESASFKSAHLYTYGHGGELLTNRKKLQIVATQAEAILLKSVYDGRLHQDLKAVGTKTGRFAGAGGVNLQALARRNKQLMSALLADPDHVFISQDISSGEPSIITQFTDDENYKYFCFDGIGKEPYWKDGVLMIDDIYLAYASVCPMFEKEIQDNFDFIRTEWLLDADKVKERLKKLRKHSKWICLGFGYGLGPKTLYKKAIEAGLQVTVKQCKDAFAAYWKLFSGIKRYADDLERHVGETGWLQNPFGYRFAPSELRKAFNGMIQSSVSGLINWYGDLMEIEAPYVDMVTVIHDEFIYSCPKEKLADFRQAQRRVVDHINTELKWCVDVRFGFAVGGDLYEAK